MALAPDEEGLLDRAHRDLAPFGATGIGGALFARWFKPNIAERHLSLPAALPDAIDHARTALTTLGTLTADGPGHDTTHALQGSVGAGTGNMNPAVVTITLTEQNQTTKVALRGVAREGFIKQRAGDQAAERIAAQLDPNH